MRFNPFRTGQGLSTEYRAKLDAKRRISIPLEQGRVFRQFRDLLWVVNQKVSIPLAQGRSFEKYFNLHTSGIG